MVSGSVRSRGGSRLTAEPKPSSCSDCATSAHRVTGFLRFGIDTHSNRLRIRVFERGIGGCARGMERSGLSPMVTTPPTPSHMGFDAMSPEPKRTATGQPSRALPLSLAPPQTPAQDAASRTPAMCTPAAVPSACTPPPELRRESLIVPQSERLVKVGKGSGVSVYRLDRSPRHGAARSPWVIKKTDISPILVRGLPRARESASCPPAQRPPAPVRAPTPPAPTRAPPPPHPPPPTRAAPAARRLVSAGGWRGRWSSSRGC